MMTNKCDEEKINQKNDKSNNNKKKNKQTTEQNKKKTQKNMHIYKNIFYMENI